jgi:hypothetical protein
METDRVELVISEDDGSLVIVGHTSDEIDDGFVLFAAINQVPEKDGFPIRMPEAGS